MKFWTIFQMEPETESQQIPLINKTLVISSKI